MNPAVPERSLPATPAARSATTASSDVPAPNGPLPPSAKVRTAHRHDIERDLAALRTAARAVGEPMNFMEVCGTHTMSVFRSGLRSLLPENVHLLSGPGCPVCVTAQGDIDQAIELAALPGAIFCTYGDMLRVPGRLGSLEAARSRGADVRVVYSSLQAVELARLHPGRPVVFCAVGFETTAPATAAAVMQAQREGLGNFSVLTSHKRVLPAMASLLALGKVQLDGFLCPGHVSIILGWECYRPLVEHYRMPCVIAGFEDSLLAAGLLRLVEMRRDRRFELINQYPEAVQRFGNPHAQALLERVFCVAQARWRGLGSIEESGLELRPAFADYDARRRFNLSAPPDHEHPGCRCGEVITGAVLPSECHLFGRQCTPTHPLGPCMVSSEGTCSAWFKYAHRAADSLPRTGGAHTRRAQPTPTRSATAEARGTS